MQVKISAANMWVTIFIEIMQVGVSVATGGKGIISSLHLTNLINTVKWGNFDWQDNFDQSVSFVKGATVPIQECLFVATTFMEINNWCSGLCIYMLLRSCLHRSNLKTSCKFGISQKNWPFFKSLKLFFSYQGKRVSYWFRIVSLDISISKKQKFSKFQKIDQSYPVDVIKVTPKSRLKLLILKI